jgi:hypothetical protein
LRVQETASIFKGLAIRRKSFLFWHLRNSQPFSLLPKTAKYPILYPIIDFAEEVVRCSPTWRFTITGGVLEQECDTLFALAISQRIVVNEDCIRGWLFSPVND